MQVALSLNNLASLLRKMNKNSQAEELYRKALSIREDALGADHPQVMTFSQSLGRYTNMWREGAICAVDGSYR